MKKRREIVSGGRRSGKTERVREAVKDAIERGEKVYLTDAPPAASTDGDDEQTGKEK